MKHAGKHISDKDVRLWKGRDPPEREQYREQYFRSFTPLPPNDNSKKLEPGSWLDPDPTVTNMDQVYKYKYLSICFIDIDLSVVRTSIFSSGSSSTNSFRADKGSEEEKKFTIYNLFGNISFDFDFLCD